MKLHLGIALTLAALAFAFTLTTTAQAGGDLDNWQSIVLPDECRLAEMAEPAGDGRPVSASDEPADGTLSADAATMRDAAGGEKVILWPGFLTGLRGFEGFAPPLGNPIYFEDPRIRSEIDIVHVWHKFPGGSTHSGGDLNLVAVQLRLALTERLALIANKSGYIWLRSDALPDHDGWADIALGLKYALVVDRDNQFLLTAGVRWELENGTGGALQGNGQELSPFVSFAKGWDRFHLMGNVTGRIPLDRDEGNHVISWDLHADYEVCPRALGGLFAVAEVHGLHYVRSGNRIGLDVGGIDVASLGSTNVAGSSVFWAGIGLHWELTPNISIGSMWEFPLHNADGDSFGQRVTSHLRISW